MQFLHSLQKDHMPNDDSTSGAHNAPLHHLHHIGKHALIDDYFNKTDNLKVTVGMRGVRFVSVERNGKFVNMTTAFGVGAVALFKIEKKGDNEINSMSEESDQEIDNSLQTLKNECKFYFESKEVSLL
jgi:delta-aminolevulinic acid dehydratase/porphobilinogen synthase